MCEQLFQAAILSHADKRSSKSTVSLQNSQERSFEKRSSPPRYSVKTPQVSGLVKASLPAVSTQNSNMSAVTWLIFVGSGQVWQLYCLLL